MYDLEEYGCPILSKMKCMLSGAKNRARSRNREFNIDLEYLSTLYVEICPILGIDLCWDNEGIVVHGSPSLDRIDNKQGYIKDNVQIISHRANSLKKDYLLVEWELMRKYMQSGGGKVLIDKHHYKEPVEVKLSPQDIRVIKKERSKGESLEDIATMIGLPYGDICRYVIELEGQI
jgi:hypothetical protein